MEYVDFIVKSILDNFDFAYMFTINVLTYIIIKTIDELNGDKNVPTYAKRLVLLLSIIIVSVIYYYTGYDKYIVLINSAILSPVFYSWVLRPILKKFKLGYKQYDEILN